MAFTHLMAGITQRIADARGMLPGNAAGPRAISRRAMLAMMAATAACSPQAAQQAAADTTTVAVVGGGVSGLVAAWRLALAGVAVELFEASGRLGGRVYTLRDFTPDGQYCELGGEFVDSGDTALLRLCGELGVGLTDVRGEAMQAVYDFGGAARTDVDLLDMANGAGAFIPVAARIAADQAALLDSGGDWTERARQLDELPLSDYLDSLRATSEAWVIDLLAMAWHAEFGVPVSRQSSLNLVDLIGTYTSQPFKLFGRRDGAMRIAGGAASLPEALAKRLMEMPLAGRVAVQTRHELAAIGREPAGVKLSFRTEGGAPMEKTYTRVVLALPFTKLRDVKGLGGLALPADKMMAISELGYGAQAKLAVGASYRPAMRILSQRGFQTAWDGSVGQAGTGGVLVNMFAGEGAQLEEAAALGRLRDGLAALSPELEQALTPKVRASFSWPSYPYARGSRAVCLAGQYTRMPEIAARPEMDGRLAFAGEHAGLDAMGTINGAVIAGERAARQLTTAVS